MAWQRCRIHCKEENEPQLSEKWYGFCQSMGIRKREQSGEKRRGKRDGSGDKAADRDYEQTLKSEMAKSEAPTIFQINGPVGYNNWKDYCANLKDTDLYSHLSDKSLAVTDGDGVYGIPYAVEGYGII